MRYDGKRTFRKNAYWSEFGLRAQGLYVDGEPVNGVLFSGETDDGRRLWAAIGKTKEWCAAKSHLLDSQGSGRRPHQMEHGKRMGASARFTRR